MSFTFDGDPLVREATCPRCGREHESVTGFVLRDGDAYAIYFANWYPHEGEAYVDVVLGSFVEADAPDDAVTFGCRLGPVQGQPGPAASLVTAGTTVSDDPRWGPRLDRATALEHLRLPDFWAVIDWLVVHDPVLHEHIYEMPAATDV